MQQQFNSKSTTYIICLVLQFITFSWSIGWMPQWIKWITGENIEILESVLITFIALYLIKVILQIYQQKTYGTFWQKIAQKNQYYFPLLLFSNILILFNLIFSFGIILKNEKPLWLVILVAIFVFNYVAEKIADFIVEFMNGA